ncbi:uncharacterized protein LOC123037472 [Drosophila rhopaloa]|uniref:Uncharacterized protein n=1 Tax=Drosophila rhopaloa TaxID=1041015 RepID=A0ABM5J646_DRORH|nr:uncharacterized protein LOC123037472 [Drosophila rhopaloa]
MHISRNIGALYDIHFNEVRIEIKEKNQYGYSITSDSLTMHYVKEGILKNRLLAVKSMGGVSCTGNQIKNKIVRILGDFGCDLLMDDQIIVTDRGANMKAAKD